MKTLLFQASWRTAVAELVLIIAGILIALGIDAHVSDLAEREDAVYYMNELGADLRAWLSR